MDIYIQGSAVDNKQHSHPFEGTDAASSDLFSLCYLQGVGVTIELCISWYLEVQSRSLQHFQPHAFPHSTQQVKSNVNSLGMITVFFAV